MQTIKIMMDTTACGCAFKVADGGECLAMVRAYYGRGIVSGPNWITCRPVECNTYADAIEYAGDLIAAFFDKIGIEIKFIE